VSRLPIAANALGRIAGRGASKSRIFRGIYSGVSTAWRSISRVLHLLFLQIVGLVFCLFGVAMAVRIPRAYRERLTGNGAQEYYLLCFLSVLFMWFGLTSFWRARRRSR
jgi:hypothetical protein